MKLVAGIVIVILGLAWARWQLKRYISRPTEALAEDALDILFDFLPNVFGALFTIFMGAALIHAHFTGG